MILKLVFEKKCFSFSEIHVRIVRWLPIKTTLVNKTETAVQRCSNVRNMFIFDARLIFSLRQSSGNIGVRSRVQYWGRTWERSQQISFTSDQSGFRLFSVRGCDLVEISGSRNFIWQTNSIIIALWWFLLFCVPGNYGLVRVLLIGSALNRKSTLPDFFLPLR